MSEFTYYHMSGTFWIKHTQKNKIQKIKQKGEKIHDSRFAIIGHVVNHSTHHRGQISGAFTQLIDNAKPCWIRFMSMA